MITELIGKKIGMTQVFEKEGGELIPVTVVQAGPCRVVQIKSEKTDGYNAVQLGFEEENKKSRLKKPGVGHCKKNGLPLYRYLGEVRIEDLSGIEVGMEFKADLFSAGEEVAVTGTSKGKGFAGVVKRHGFSGGPMSHGSRFHRGSGAIGHHANPNKIFKGKPMAGHMGVERVTVKSLKVVEIIADQNIILIKGAVPGGENGILRIRKKPGKKAAVKG
ncbi:MAG: 50S ribosomal protein L3 [bacterium]